MAGFVGAACASWSGDEGHTFQEIVRQQWNFSPPNSIREAEKYRVELFGVTVLELVIGARHLSRNDTRLAQESAPGSITALIILAALDHLDRSDKRQGVQR